jgi:hypothetical protein
MRVDFLAPMISTIIPMPMAPTISPTPRVTMANIESSKMYSGSSFPCRVPVIMGTSMPVYTEILTPVHATCGMSGLNFLETRSLSTDFISSEKED